MVETTVELNNTVLDLGKHSAVTFKENSNLNVECLGGGDDPAQGNVGKFVLKGCGSNDKGGSSRGGRKLNRAIKERGECFKLVGTSKTLSESMNSIVELIGDQLNKDAEKVVMNPVANPTNGTGSSK
ncbi:hypothetical protein PVK06_041450 [Gossypium arboreum]|uniref:Uncharacterized protein n=1 Tax=Gossypium arboreum TaxID=29729 RepID=A0ABR0N8A0_GOSAR|nr:hypothetical protein PVK06_041450 [Gossypium arboreum]